MGGVPAPLDLQLEVRLVSFLWRAAPLSTLVHDVSDGGLAVCLAEAAFHSSVGVCVELDDDPLELFGEIGGRAVVSCPPEGVDALSTLARELEVPLCAVGAVGGATLLGVELAELRRAWGVGL